ncbi:MAG: SUMF1/EgtB/PvdO family nonheme iron enzyme [Candidatus Sumerlaeota bacterium]|nr:SUMF1/EgtB/PvdO family nonheme iron enzyme [Candidatus Sumerlaeota bacterium]
MRFTPARPGWMTINGATGQVSWSNPTTAGSPHTVRIRARNSLGYDDEIWTLTVVPANLPGDVSGNGTVTAFDARRIEDYIHYGTQVTLELMPDPLPLGTDDAGVFVRVRIPTGSFNRAGLARLAEEAALQREAPRVSGEQGIGPQGIPWAVMWTVDNTWKTTSGYFYGAVQFVANTGESILHAVTDLTVTVSNIQGQLTAEILDEIVDTSSNPVQLAFTAAHNSGLLPGYDLRLWDWTDSSDTPKILTGSGPAKENVVIFVHGIRAFYTGWSQMIQGLVGAEGSSRDSDLALLSGSSVGAWVTQYYFHTSTTTNGEKLADKIEAYVSPHDSEIKNLYIVAHSMGCLITRHALERAENQHQGWLNKVRAVAYLGGMHEETDLQAAASDLLNEVSKNPVTSSPLTPVSEGIGGLAGLFNCFYVDSDGIHDLGVNIGADVGIPAGAPIRYDLVASDQPSKWTEWFWRSKGYGGANDGWVPRYSSYGDAATPTADFAGVSGVSRKLWPDGDPAFQPASPWGGHVQLVPSAGEPSGGDRTIDKIRKESRYQAIRNFLFPGSELPRKTFLINGTVPLEMVQIPAGSFQMGSPDTERSRYSDEGPVHTVNIGYSYYLGKCGVTQRQWQAVTGTNPVAYAMSQWGWANYGLGDSYPAYYVSWDDCQSLISALNSKGLGGTFRLPSEAEWEYACRANAQTRFFFGDSLSVDDYNQDGPAGTLPGSATIWLSVSDVPRGRLEPRCELLPVGDSRRRLLGFP